MAHRRSSKVLLKHCSHPEDWLAVVQLFCPIQIAEVDLSILWHFKTSFGVRNCPLQPPLAYPGYIPFQHLLWLQPLSVNSACWCQGCWAAGFSPSYAADLKSQQEERMSRQPCRAEGNVKIFTKGGLLGTFFYVTLKHSKRIRRQRRKVEGEGEHQIKVHQDFKTQRLVSF